MVVGWEVLGAAAALLIAVAALFRGRGSAENDQGFQPLNQPFRRLNSGRTHRQVRFALYAILLVAGGHILLLTWQAEEILERQRQDAVVTNLAGRQRMHSQRVGRLASLQLATPNRERDALALPDVLAQAKTDAERLQSLLKDNFPSIGDQAQDALLISQWNAARSALYERAEALLRTIRSGHAPSPTDVQGLQDAVEPALAAAEALVAFIERTVQARHRDDVVRYQFWAAATVVLLIALGLVIAEPTVSAVKSQNLQIAAQTRDLERLALVAALTENAVLIADGHFRIMWVNNAFTRITGYSAEEAVGLDLRRTLGGLDLQLPQQSSERALERPTAPRAQLLTRHKTGEELWLEVDVQPLVSSKDDEGGLVAVAADMTERRRSQADLRLAAIAFNSLEAMAITDAKQVILRVNSAFTRITGYSASEACGQVVGRLLRSGRHDAEFYRAMWQQLTAHRHWQGEVWNRRKDGEIYPEWLSITAVVGDHGDVANYVAVFTDITQKKLAEETIHNLAFYDPLTELPNRRLMRDRLEQLRSSHTSPGQVAAVLFIDLDKFKELNDTRGHDIGDALLVEVSCRLRSCVRANDTVSRQGGDEFVVILSDLNPSPQAGHDVAVIAEKIRAALARPYDLLGIPWHCTASIGICMFDGAQDALDEVLKRADIAMYEAKRAGRNAVRFYDPATHAAIQLRTGIEADLRDAMALQQLTLHFQPQVDADHKTVGAEVLLRWSHPVRGPVSPADFIPVAEETDLILPIGQWVLLEACRQLRDWAGNPLTSRLQLSVNVSARQFRQPDFVAQVRRALEESGADPYLLKLELTETLVLVSIEDTLSKMKDIRALGVRFAIDDFGTGQSSLAYLTKLSLDQLKIDQAFVAGMLDSHTDGVIVQTMIGMARTLGLDVIAEGVETLEQLAFLKSSGCYCYQGYLFGRPVPLGAFMARIDEAGKVDMLTV
jgi:diguanylate cyclase (GGDEF)-like protein/PAS domain S-box-containing protein